MFICVYFFLLATEGLHLAVGGSAKRSSNQDSPIKYPGPVMPVSNRYGGPEDGVSVPEQCKGQQYCTIKPPDYPQERFNKLFKGYKPLGQPSLVLDDGFNDRFADGSTDGCETDITYEPLYQVRGEAGDWRTVVQAPDEDFVQRVRLETCRNPKDTCFQVYNPDPGVEVYCKQMYNTWEVLVARGKDGTEKIKTNLPVCCSCHYRLV